MVFYKDHLKIFVKNNRDIFVMVPVYRRNLTNIYVTNKKYAVKFTFLNNVVCAIYLCVYQYFVAGLMGKLCKFV